MNNDRKQEGLKALGSKTEYAKTYTPEVLERFHNQHRDND